MLGAQPWRGKALQVALSEMVEIKYLEAHTAQSEGGDHARAQTLPGSLLDGKPLWPPDLRIPDL